VTQKAKGKHTATRRKGGPRQVPLEVVVERALGAPFGPCWISRAIDGEPDGGAPALITVVVSRRVGELLLPSVALVDRTCLGVKNAFLPGLQDEREIERWISDAAEAGDPLKKTELLFAQSVIFHAIDYASTLGFSPHPGFVLGLIGERPASLLDTPLARPERPLYIAGPDDDEEQVLAQLDASVGPDNYDAMAEPDLDEDELDDDELDEDELDEDELDEDELDESDTETDDGNPPLAPGRH
jgi:hypothetical protein